MIGRRDLITSSVAAGLAGLADARTDAAPVTTAADDGGQGDRDVATAITSMSALLNTTLTLARKFTEIEPIREIQKKYLVANGKFPDFIDVGINVWFDVHDWHIKWQQPVAIGRDASNRRTIVLYETALVLRLDLLPNFIGLPYDKP